MQPPPPRSMRPFLLIWLGQLISLVGSGLTSFALGVWIFERTQQALPFAITILLATLPRVIFAPLAGIVVDRANRRTVILLADTANALATLALAALLLASRLEVWHVYLIALAGAISSTFQEPAYMASITLLVPKTQLGRASGLGQLSQALEMVLVPTLAGVLFSAVGLAGIVVIDVVTYVFALGTLLTIRIPPVPVDPAAAAQPRSWRGDLTAGWHYLRARPGLLLLLWYFALVNFLLNFASVLRSPLVLASSSASGLGFVETMAGVGMLAGSIAASVWDGPRRRMPLVIGCVSVAALGLVITGLSSSLWVIGGGSLLLMAGIPLGVSANQALFQSKIAPAVQGRVFALRTMITRSLMPLAFLGAGLLADNVFEPLMREGGSLAVSPLGTLVGVGPGRGIGLLFSLAGLALLAVSGLALAHPRLRRLEDDLPDAETGDHAATDVVPKATPRRPASAEAAA